MVKLILLSVLAAVCLSSATVWAHSAGTPQHGGVVAAANELEYELLAKPEVIRLYVRDHDKPVDISNASARVTLLSGEAKQDVELKPAGDKLEATGSFSAAPGTKAVVVIILKGKPLTARFTVK